MTKLKHILNPLKQFRTAAPAPSRWEGYVFPSYP